MIPICGLLTSKRGKPDSFNDHAIHLTTTLLLILVASRGLAKAVTHPPGRLSAGPPAPGGPGPPPDQRPAAVGPLPHRPGPDASLHDARLQRPVSAEQLPHRPTDRLRHPSVPRPACLHQPAPHGPRPPGSPAPPRSRSAPFGCFWKRGLCCGRSPCSQPEKLLTEKPLPVPRVLGETGARQEEREREETLLSWDGGGGRGGFSILVS